MRCALPAKFVAIIAALHIPSSYCAVALRGCVTWSRDPENQNGPRPKFSLQKLRPPFIAAQFFERTGETRIRPYETILAALYVRETAARRSFICSDDRQRSGVNVTLKRTTTGQNPTFASNSMNIFTTYFTRFLSAFGRDLRLAGYSRPTVLMSPPALSSKRHQKSDDRPAQRGGLGVVFLLSLSLSPGAVWGGRVGG